MTTSFDPKLQKATVSGNSSVSDRPLSGTSPETTIPDGFVALGKNQWKSLVTGSGDGETPNLLGPLVDGWAATPPGPGDDLNNALSPLMDEFRATEPLPADALPIEQAMVQMGIPETPEGRVQSLLQGLSLGAPARSSIPDRAYNLPEIPKVAKLMERKELFESSDAIKGLLDRLTATEKTYRILYKETLHSIHSGRLFPGEDQDQRQYSELLKRGLIDVQGEIAQAREFLSWRLHIDEVARREAAAGDS